MNPDKPYDTKGRALFSLYGIFSILIWSTSVAFARSLSKEIGYFTAGACIYIAGGIISLGIVMVRGSFRKITAHSGKYLFGCGGLFTAYTVCLYAALGLSRTDSQAVEAGLVNYLWPSLLILFSVPILKRKARWPLIPGVIIAFSGVAAATLQNEAVSLRSFLSNISTNWIPYAAALCAAVIWGLYSSLARRWGGRSEASGVPLFIAATGLILLILACLFPENSHWSARVLCEWAWMVIFPTVTAYIFWDISMRRGNSILIALLSYFTPLISTFISCMYLKIIPGIWLWIGCVLAVCGALICGWSIRESSDIGRSLK